MTNLTAAQAVKEIIETAMGEARRIAQEDEARLGRPLTDGEVGQIATMVRLPRPKGQMQGLRQAGGSGMSKRVDLDIQGALDTTMEADGADLPLGFGRD